MGRKSTFEYADNWRLTCIFGLRLMPFCSCNPFHGKAAAVHHVKYKRGLLRRLLGIFLFHAPRKSVSGCEIIGYDAFPICENCHHNVYGRSDRPSSLHYIKAWKQLGGLENHNVASVAWRLRFKFWFWVAVLWLGRGLFGLFKKRKRKKL